MAGRCADARWLAPVWVLSRSTSALTCSVFCRARQDSVGRGDHDHVVEATTVVRIVSSERTSVLRLSAGWPGRRSRLRRIMIESPIPRSSCRHRPSRNPRHDGGELGVLHDRIVRSTSWVLMQGGSARRRKSRSRVIWATAALTQSPWPARSARSRRASRSRGT